MQATTFSETGASALEPPERRIKDPILLRVIGGQLNAIAKEMASTLQRTAYSQLARENEDLGAGLFDRHGRELAESQTTPLHNGSIGGMIRGFLERLDGKIEEGDVIFHNHPYKGAVHAPDICVAIPIFADGELVGFAADTCHLIDTGGAYPGINVDVVDMWAESRIYDALKVYSKGERNEELWKHIIDNTRTPTLNRGDLSALIGACQVGRKRFLELIGKYGTKTILDAGEDWMDYAEYMLRSEIAQVPDGVYEAPVGWLDDDGKHRTWLEDPEGGAGDHLEVRVKVTVKGTDLIVDLTGSNPEVETAFNSPFEGATQCTAYFIARTVFLDEAKYDEYIPQNEGCYRPIEVICPKGTIFNPSFPRATFARFCPVQRIADGFVLSLADAAPDKVAAGSAAHTYFVSYSGWDDAAQEYWAYLETNEGTYGGRSGSDGMEACDTHAANTRNTPVEELELRFPIRVERYELSERVPAPGRWRGGGGVVRENRMLVDAIVSCEGDRSYDPPRGIHGGDDGLPGRITHVYDGGGEQQLYSKFSGYRVRAGDVIRFESPLGGGYGDPMERDPELVLRDVLDDYITTSDAREHYGVVLAGDGRSVDGEATARLRGGG
jgi:N-methylhydantoinase B/oxoprolinase/acetone carboxylase alpha subunit